MMTAAKLGAGSTDYYEKTTARDARIPGADMTDYYGEHGDAAPRAFVVGRDDEQRAALEQFLGVEHGQTLDGDTVATWFNKPVAPSGAALGRAYTDRSVYGYDVTTAAPKSVSMLWGLSDDPDVHRAIEDAHQAAIQTALGYLAEHAGYTREHNEATGKKDLVQTRGLSGAAYEHRTSRAGDPHLHTHVLIHNRQERADGQGVGSLDGASLLHELKAGGSIYQAALRSQLTQSLGVEWQPVDPTTGQADIAGFTREQIEAWSQRHTQISEWAKTHTSASELDPASAAQLGQAQKATRDDKEIGKETEELRAEWRDDSRSLSKDDLADVLGRVWRDHEAAPLPTAHDVLTQLAEVRSTFTRADAVEVAAALMPTTADPATVRDQVEALAAQVTGEALVLSVDPDKQHGEREAHEREGSVRYSSRQAIEREQRMMRAALAHDERAAVRAETIAAHADALDRLSGDQRQAVEKIAASGQRVTPFIAPAGSGKTFSLASLKALYEAEDRSIIGLAPTGKAADVMSAEGVVSGASTVAAMRRMINGDRHGWNDRTVVVVDEAGMLGTPDLAALIDAAAAAGAKMILAGDPAQLDPVKAAAGGFQLLAENAPDTVRLAEVRRQVNKDERVAGLALRDGTRPQVNAAADFYTSAGRLHHGNEGAMLEAAYQAWKADRATGVDARMIAQRNEIADALNARAQADALPALRERAERDAARRGLTGEKAEAFVSAKLATAQASRGQYVRAGDDVITRMNTPKLRARTQRGEDAGGIRNGQTWRAIEVKRDGSLVVERDTANGGTAQAFLPADYVKASTHLGYAVSVHAAQGMTADRVHAVLDGSTASRGTAYVAMTRGRQSNNAYITDSRVGDQPHEHGESAEQVKPWRATPAEARAAFVSITERDNRDRAAHTVIKDARKAYAQEQRERAEQEAELRAQQARHERRNIEAGKPTATEEPTTPVTPRTDNTTAATEAGKIDQERRHHAEAARERFTTAQRATFDKIIQAKQAAEQSRSKDEGKGLGR